MTTVTYSTQTDTHSNSGQMETTPNSILTGLGPTNNPGSKLTETQNTTIKKTPGSQLVTNITEIDSSMAQHLQLIVPLLINYLSPDKTNFNFDHICDSSPQALQKAVLYLSHLVGIIDFCKSEIYFQGLKEESKSIQILIKIVQNEAAPYLPILEE